MEPNINNVVQSFCINKDDFGVMEELSINSYLMNGHKFHLYTYDDNLRVPKGVILYDANEIFEIQKNLLMTINKSLFLDFFRCQLLYVKGGWWVNLDTVCLKPFNFKHKYIFSSILDYDSLNGTCNSNKISTHIIKTPNSADFLYDFLNYIRLRGLNNLRIGEISVNFFNTVLFNYEFKNNIKQTNVFSPYHYHEVYEIVKPLGNIKFNDKTYAISLWKEMWLKMGLDTNKPYHSESIYEQLKSKYL